MLAGIIRERRGTDAEEQLNFVLKRWASAEEVAASRGYASLQLNRPFL